MMLTLVRILIITVVVIMLSLAANSIINDRALDQTWSLLLGGVIAAVLGVPEVSQRLRKQRESSPKSEDSND